MSLLTYVYEKDINYYYNIQIILMLNKNTLLLQMEIIQILSLTLKISRL